MCPKEASHGWCAARRWSHAVCNLLRTPGFAPVTILRLALGIASANLANRLMGRAESRRRELAVRAALGASRGRLRRQFVVEDCLLSFTGAALGLGVAVLGVRSLIAAYPQPPAIGRRHTGSPRARLHAVIGLLTGAVFGLTPLPHLSSDAISIALKEGGTRTRPRRGATGFPAGSWRRRSRS